jgi:hypothetical protein
MAVTESFLEKRREVLRGLTDPPVNGIDYVEVRMAARQIEVHLVHPLPGGAGGVPDGAGAITAAMVRITGGDRLRDIRVESIATDGARVLVVEVAALGDFSVYTLHIDHPGFDVMLREIRFSFRATCPTDFDCADGTDTPADVFAPAAVNHLAKDYDSFRTAMLDRMAALVPDWQDRQAGDLGVTLVELMAHYADHLSYAQDAAATEAYIGTARRRGSVRRHAQLIGYDVHDGLSAHVFVQVQVAADMILGAGDLTFLTGTSDGLPPATTLAALQIDRLLAEGVAFFEPAPMLEQDPATPDLWVPRPIRLQAAANDLILYDWGDPAAMLAAGATSAWIVAAPGLTLGPGDLIALEQARDPVTLRLADADPAARQVVCLTEAPVAAVDPLNGALGPVDVLRITWGADDALRFDLPVGRLDAVADGGSPYMARAGGNIVPASHGITLAGGEALGTPDSDDDPEQDDAISQLSALDRPRRFRPVLRRRDISVSGPLRVTPGQTSATALIAAASGTATGTIARPVTAIRVSDGTGLADWRSVNSLIFARDDDRVFVAETEGDGTTILRFGGPETGGQVPAPGTPLTAHYRIGIGRGGNIGAGAIAHVAGPANLVSARNPLPGFGGRDRESLTEIRLNALRRLDDNRRAVTKADYERLAGEHPAVQRAFVRTLGHGSWTTFVVAVDPLGGIHASAEFLRGIRAWLEPLRMMGQDLIVEAPRFAPLDIGLRVCICRGHSDSAVRRAVEAALGAGTLPDGTRGFFHPDSLSFGDSVYLSRIIAAVKSVPGVADVAVDTFRKWRTTDTLALQNGILQVDPSEIPILMNDRNHPERGVLRIAVWEAA